MPSLEAFHFLRPLFLLGIPLAAALGWLVAKRHTLRSRWLDVIDAQLRPVMLDERRSASARSLPLCVALAFALASLILAGPTWQRLPQNVQQRNDALVLILDLSLSMYAGDLAPSRLTLARHKLVDVLRRRKEGFTALVVYAGDAHVVVPLTDDVATIENLLGGLAPAMMPALGSNVPQALDLATDLVRNAALEHGRILLVTDGIDRLSDVSEHCRRSMPLSILGVGTPDGGPIPLAFVDQPGRYLTNRAGERVIARLDDARLEQAAGVCGGRYARIRVDDGDIAALLAEDVGDDGGAAPAAERTFDLWDDAGQYVVLLLAPLLALAFRRGVVVALALCVASPADAGLWDDLWQRRDQQAVEALQDGEPERATALFEDPQWRGVAEYRSQNYEGAQARFEADGSAAGHYNRGNALARQQRYPEAIAAYDQALALAPDDEDAKFNKALLEKLLAEQEQSEGQSNQSSPDRRDRDDAGADPEQRAGEQNRREGAERADADRDSRPADPDDTPGDAGSRADQRSQADAEDTPRDEQQDALERWLRRVPDDPGGLLRRKFQYETNQRMRRGEYPEREERIW